MKKHALARLALALAGVCFISACGTQNAAGSSSAAMSQGMASSAAASSAASAASASGVTKVTPEQGHEMLQSGDPLVLVDVRTADEYAEAHIPGAILLPNEDIGTERPAQLPVLDTPIMVYCRSGRRSADAAEKLSKMGYTNVYDLGGLQSWTYETEAGAWQQPDKAGTLASFAAFDLNGIAADESIFASGKLTMVNIWATYCGPCLNEMPELGKLAADYKDKGVQVVGIVSDVPQNADGSFDLAQVENARSLVEETGADYRHLLVTSDLEKAALQDVYAVPTTLFVDSAGNIVGETYVGSRSGEDWAKIIDSLLAQEAKTA